MEMIRQKDKTHQFDAVAIGGPGQAAFQDPTGLIIGA
jgi:hypothetical protein